MSDWCYKQYKGEKTIYFYNDFIALDTETSHLGDDTWINSIQVLFKDRYYHFRKPSELINFYNDLINTYHLNYSHRLVTVIHNASYDLSYLLPYIQLYLPDKDDHEGIYDGKTKIKKYRQGGLEFRCSFMLSGESLESWSKNLNVKNKKQIGIYDYSKVIYQDDDLTDDEKLYDEMDVRSLHECYKKQMEIYGDNIATVPNTATGYVRRDFRKASTKMKRYREIIFHHGRLDVDSYKFCIDSYAGGYTHNNRFEKDKIIEGLIGHRDFRSMYPSVMRCYPLPFGTPQMIYSAKRSKEKITTKEILDLYPKYSTISKIYISEVSLKDPNITMPFMQSAKLYIQKTEKILLDNGRILYFKGHCTTYIDNHTLKILSEQYNIKGKIQKVYAFENIMMPKCLAVAIDEYFKEKANRKILVKEAIKKYGRGSEEHLEAEMYYLLAKKKLNGIYGMFATNPVGDAIDFDIELPDFFSETKCSDDDSIQEALNNYYGSRNNFLTYQVGVFVTALARYELYEYIKIIGYENVLYCDTDSIFYKKNPEIEKKIEELNAKKHENAVALKAYVTDNNGKDIYYDVFEQEDDLVQFKGLHSKCYGFVTTDGDFSCTIAGVPARTLVDKVDDELIYVTRESELGSLEKLEDQFTFKINTGTTCKYKMHLPKIIYINGHAIETSGGGIIEKLESKQIKDFDSPDLEDYDVEVVNSI